MAETKGRPVTARYPRDLALRALARVLSEGEALDRVLEALGPEAGEGRAWLQEVTSGTLRWMGRLDQAIDSAAIKKKPSGWLRRALRLAAYQLIVQAPGAPGAIVSEAVEQVKRKEGEAPARFVNALLRRIAEHAEAWRELPFPAGAGAAEAAAWASLPEWMWKRLVRDHGEEWARAYARASLERPTLWLKAKEDGWGLPWLDSGPVAGSRHQARDAAVAGGIAQWPGFGEGAFIVQDISSQRLAHEITARVRAARGGGSLAAIDWCAAPGGKSVSLAWAGFAVTASDADPARLPLLEQTVGRAARGAVRVVPFAALADAPAADLVWVDAPCTGSGILRRHPDARWLKRESDLEALHRAQEEALSRAWSRVAPGGFLAYSVCSVFNAEGPDRLAALPADAIREAEWRLAPQDAPYGDGFYAALLRKA